MGKINVGRVILGGIVGGIVFDLLESLVDGIWLAPSWDAQMKLLVHHGLPAQAIIGFNLIGILGGLATIWIYAAIRPRFGAGVKTAIYAGVVAWVLSSLVPNTSFMWVGGLFSKHLTLYTTVGNFFEIVIGTIVGASLYKEA